jgi:asparagine synthase (glutamine-hydrolysing)
MCSICGVIAKDEGEDGIVPTLEMLDAMGHRGPDSAGLAWDEGVVTASGVNSLIRKATSISGPRAVGHARLRITGGDGGLQPFVGGNDSLSLVFNGEIYNYDHLGNHQLNLEPSELDSDGEVLFRLIEREHDGDGKEALIGTIPALDGVYAMALMDEKSIVLYRDKLGIKQVYYGESGSHHAFASERKALWRLGMRSRRLNPGHLLRLDPDTAHTHEVETFAMLPIVHHEAAEAMAGYERVLMEAVRKRIRGHRRVGVLFSGGVDSVMVAQVASKLGVEVIGYIGGVPGSPDLKAAAEAADTMGIPLRARYLRTDDIRELLPPTIEAIEDRDLMQVEVALPMFGALELAKQDGIRVMLTGQGADELFGGYEWYPPILNRRGERALLTSMWNDIQNLYRDTLEREDKMSMWHSIELRVPFLDPALIRQAMMTSPWLKINRSNGSHDRFGKRLHREMALKLGVPRSVAYRLKDGAQHGSGIHEAIEGIALGTDPSGVEPLELDEPELRGSAFRYEGIDVEEGSYGAPAAQALVDEIAREVFSPVLSKIPDTQRIKEE